MAVVSATQLLHEGQIAYAEKNYLEALKISSQTLSLPKNSVNTQLAALDLRCQTYHKLGQHDLALKDARHIVHASKRQDATGYLRCSQIERHQSNFHAALRWLEHGAKNVPQQRDMFMEQCSKVQELAAKHKVLQKRQDPVASVPLEVLQIILSYFEYTEIVRLLRVSKTWRNVLSRIQPLVTTIDFSGSKRLISLQSCNAGLRRLCRTPQKVVLSRLSTYATNAIQSWLCRFTNLETLQVLHLDDSRVRCSSLRFDKLRQIQSLQVGPSQKISLKILLESIAACPTLQELIVHGINGENLSSLHCVNQPQLRHLRLCGGFALPASLLASYPSLESLCLEQGHIESNVLDLSNHSRLKEVRLNLASQECLDLNLPSQLEELNIDGSTNMFHPTIFTIADPVELPDLRRMTFRNVWACAAIDALETSDRPPSLRAIKFENVWQDLLNRKYSKGCRIFRECSSLSFMSHELTDSDSGTFATLFPAVETLMIETPMVTGVFVSDFVSREESKLTQVVLKDCDKISSDIVKWLNNKGIRCRMLSTTHK